MGLNGPRKELLLFFCGRVRKIIAQQQLGAGYKVKKLQPPARGGGERARAKGGWQWTTRDWRRSRG